MKKILLLLLISVSTLAYAQTWVKGIVIDEKTKEPLPGVSVYLNNTTIGTTTDGNGKFSLGVSLGGKIELVASYIGYEKKILILEDYSETNLTVALKPQNNLLNEVVVKAKKGDDFDKWGSLFNRMLLANVHSVGTCTIKNPNALVFYFDKEQNQLRVFAKETLIIENNNLGYILKLDLEEFGYNFNTDMLSVVYSTFFEEMKSPKIGKEEVLKQRKIAYYGSQMHFMRSVYGNALTKNGFKIYKYSSVKNTEKERVTKLVQQRINRDSKLQTSVTYDLNKLFQPRDTAEYYKMIMAQDDIVHADTILNSMRKYTQLNRAQDVMFFNTSDTLMVNYVHFLDRFNKIVDPQQLANWKSQNVDKRYKGGNTIIYFFNQGGINVQPSGYYPELVLAYQGDMFTRRVAQLLPWDYDPEK